MCVFFLRKNAFSTKLEEKNIALSFIVDSWRNEFRAGFVIQLISLLSNFLWFPSHHSMARARFAYGGDGLYI
jgi:hypothetical protein